MPLEIEPPPAAPADSSRRMPAEAMPGALVIGLINNMPDSALEGTENQFKALLKSAAGERNVILRLASLPEVPRGAEARARIEQRYWTLDQLIGASPDAIIVTGTEPKTAVLSDEPYWARLVELIEYADAHLISSAWSCLAAHAAVLHRDGIERRALKQKRCGVFDFRLTGTHPMTEHFPDPLWVPHSRYNDLPERALTASGYKILSRSKSAGVDTFAKQDGSFFLFFQGHPEYEADTLLREYRRDAVRYLVVEPVQVGIFDPL